MKRRIRQKAALLLCLTVFLVMLAASEGTRRDPEPEEGEALEIPKGPKVPEESWELPEGNANIRVLLLNGDGGIYHEEETPSREYPGKIEAFQEEEGWVLVNEVNLEEYLKRVVPSEMPSGYAKEALKAQAVCARTYAIWHMREYAYPEYEAHVDDSVSYQVYNNIESQDSTDQAVEATRGQIMLYEGVPAKAYYFATSCGSTTDESIWEEGDRDLTPYISGRRVRMPENERASSQELSSEEDFAAFIRKKGAEDLEIGEPWYRWSCYVPLHQITENVERWAGQRAARTADGVLFWDGETYRRQEKNSAGDIQEARILSREEGGAAKELLLIGSQGTLKVKYEYNIRLMLGLPGGEIEKNDGTKGKGGSLLPSGYFVLEEVKEGDVLTGYRVYGGGLGHGAGMSQNGARLLAERGSGYEEILKYFYDGISLAVLEQP